MTKSIYLVFFALPVCVAVENGRNAAIVAAKDEDHARRIVGNVSDSDILPWMFADTIKLGEADQDFLPIMIGNPKPVNAKDYRNGELPSALLELLHPDYGEPDQPDLI